MKIGLIVGALALLAVVGFVLLQGHRAATALAVGDCFDGGQGTSVASVTAKKCDEPHDGEVYAVLPVSAPGDQYPGQTVVQNQGDEQCNTAAQTTVAPGAPDDLTYYVLSPSEATWRNGDRSTVCFFTRTGGQKLTQSVRIP